MARLGGAQTERGLLEIRFTEVLFRLFYLDKTRTLFN